MTTESTVLALRDLRWLHGFARFLASDVDDADDLVQETLVRAWESPPPDARRTMRPWLATVMRNRLRMGRRSEARRLRREQQAADLGAVENPADPARELERVELLHTLIEEIERLDPVDRQIIVRRFFEDQNASEIGRELSMSPATVRSRLHRSLRHLRAGLDERAGGRAAWSVVVVPAGSGTSVSPELSRDVSPVVSKGWIAVAAGGVVAAVAGWAVWAELSSPGQEPRDAGGGGEVVADVEHTSPDLPATQNDEARTAWEARRSKVRASLGRADASAATDDQDGDDEADALRRSEHAAFMAVRRDCVDDLAPDASGALTFEAVLIGAPDIGVVYESIDVVETTLEDPEVLECITESMYGYVGEAPSRPFERHFRRTAQVGHPRDADTKLQRMFEAIVGAHISEVEACERKHASAPGVVNTTFVLGPDKGPPVEVRAGDTELPGELVACMVGRAETWTFPEALANREWVYRFEIPVRG